MRLEEFLEILKKSRISASGDLDSYYPGKENYFKVVQYLEIIKLSELSYSNEKYSIVYPDRLVVRAIPSLIHPSKNDIEILDPPPKKICLIGVHGNGKSTYLNLYNPKYVKFNEIVRELMDKGTVSRHTSLKDQEIIYRHKKKQFDTVLNYKKEAIIDRSPMDVLAYSYEKGYITWDQLVEEIKRHKHKYNQFDYIYVRKYKDWTLVRDLYRSGDIEFYNRVDAIFDKIYDVLVDFKFFVSKDTTDRFFGEKGRQI